MKKEKLINKMINDMWLVAVGSAATAIGLTRLLTSCSGDAGRYIHALYVIIGGICIFMSLFYALHNLEKLTGYKFKKKKTTEVKPKEKNNEQG